MGYQASGHQRLQVAVSDSLMTQICVISFLRLQIAVSDSLMTQMCVKSSLEDNERLDSKMCQIKIRDCNFLVLTHFCVIVDPSMQFPWRLKNGLMAPPCSRPTPYFQFQPDTQPAGISANERALYKLSRCVARRLHASRQRQQRV